MKLITSSFAFGMLLGLAGTSANAIDMRNLSLTPFESCKKPPKAPPPALLHKHYNSYGTPSNFPFDDTRDINGDGWCDWVSSSAGAPHRGDVDEPEMEDFIFMGAANGWRKFGDMKRVRSDHSENVWLAPYVEAFNFIYPKLVYLRSQKEPFIVVLSSSEDIAPMSVERISIFRWDDLFDMPRSVTNMQDRETILEFLKIKLCEPGKDYTDNFSLANVICAKDNYPSHP